MHESPGDWLPARAALHPNGLYFSLRDIAPAELEDAFMQETIARVPAREAIVELPRGAVGEAAAGSAPAGIVFHVARCGSTLVSQLLKRRGGAVVYAEPLPVNEILLPPPRWLHGERVAALRSLGALFAHHAKRPYVLKLTSWNTLFCDEVAEAFPHTHWVLVLRDPVEVCVSLLARPPGWIWERDRPSATFASFIDPSGESRTREDYVARLYGAFCRAACRLDRARGRLVTYGSLPAAVWESVAPHFRLPVDAAARARMGDAARQDSKSAARRPVRFEPDSAAKQQAATMPLREAVAAFAEPHLRELVKRHA